MVESASKPLDNCQAWGTDHVQLITKENYNEHCAALMAQTSVIHHILITYNLQLYIHISYNAHMFINNLHCTLHWFVGYGLTFSILVWIQLCISSSRYNMQKALIVIFSFGLQCSAIIIGMKCVLNF